MRRYIPEKYYNSIFLAILVSAVIILIAIYEIGAQQDKAYRENYNLYQQAIQLIGEEKYPQAKEVLAKLDADSQANYNVLYMQAVCAEKSGDLALAAEYLQKVRETRPALLQDQEYLCRYGVVLYQLGEYERARLYLRESLKYPKDAGTTEEANKYLAEIDRKSGGGR